MALNSIMASALSGLQTAQTSLTTVSNNITNVNTPGYAREIVDQSPLVAGGVGDGVTVDDVRRVTSSYLESANYNAGSAAGSAGIISNLLDQAQAAFGDPTQAGSYLNQLSSVFSDFTAAANDPASSLPRSQTLDDMTSFLDTTQTVAGTLSGLNTQADGQITSDVSQANQLLSQIAALNTQIQHSNGNGGNASGSQDAQSQLLGQLSSLMQINVNTQPDGTVVVRSSNGQLLTNGAQAATLSYTPSVSGIGTLSVVTAGMTQPTTLQVGDGELSGLIALRNNIIPGLQQQLSGYVSQAAATLNAAHNANTAAPPPQTLTGRNTGLDLTTIAGDFTGKTNIAIVDSSGNLTKQVTIDFSGPSMSVNGGAGVAFTPSTFLTALNTALGASGSASFTNGVLSISASASGSGVAIADDPTTPASNGGQGFSQFFGMNDLLTSSEITNYNTGLKTTDANGFAPGSTITLQIATSAGLPTNTITVAVPAAGSPTMQDLLNSLNAPIGGVGNYGSFSLDAKGAMTFTPSTPGSTLSVVQDTTKRGVNGPSISQLFGVGVTQQASRATTFQVRADIDANPMNLSLAKLDLPATVGTSVVALGDSSGATALAAAANSATTFAAAGDLPAMSTSITQYAARLGGDLGQKSSAADTAKTSATAVQTEATTRLQSVEGVNLDEELVNLTTFQQAYSASARLIQAAKDMTNTLLDMVP
jgi:flagellar hook-associated protein 1 FlgK